jgi:hypothetical protein
MNGCRALLVSWALCLQFILIGLVALASSCSEGALHDLGPPPIIRRLDSPAQLAGDAGLGCCTFSVFRVTAHFDLPAPGFVPRAYVTFVGDRTRRVLLVKTDYCTSPEACTREASFVVEIPGPLLVPGEALMFAVVLVSGTGAESPPVSTTIAL